MAKGAAALRPRDALAPSVNFRATNEYVSGPDSKVGPRFASETPYLRQKHLCS
jgi:hypothetical protein